MHSEQQEMGGSRDARDRPTHLTIEHRRLTLIEPALQPVTDRSARGRSPATEIGFGGRLRLERERRRVTLAAIASDTKISLALLQGLERDDVSRWPSGIFRRSFIRAYAQAIGLDADVVTRDFLEHHRDPADPPRAASADSAPRSPHRASDDTALRLTLADAGGTVRPQRVPGGMWRRLAGVAWDVSILMAVALAFFVVFKQFWMPVAIATLGYYVASIVLLGKTPGAHLCAPSSKRPRTHPTTGIVSSGSSGRFVRRSPN
jgi:transcriptional regulator with XRE-family HTH domain